MIKLLNRFQDMLDVTRKIDFLGPLALRLYLAPIFWMAGTKKLADMENTIGWFGSDGLGLPYPFLLAWAAVLAEVVGAISLTFGIAVRWMCIPLLITMAVAAYTVHWDNGWLVISGNDGVFATERTTEAVSRLSEFKVWLKTEFPGWSNYVNKHGRLVMLNNGIEFAATYFVMLLALFFIGAGRYFSVDHWIARFFRKKSVVSTN